MKAVVLSMVLLVALPACEKEERAENRAAPAAPEAPATTRTSNRPRIVFLGDSLTAGLGVDADEAYPALLAGMLEKEGLSAQVVNAGVSGDTTAGGLRRLDWLLKQSPQIVVVGLGGNDGLRGVELKSSEENLRQIVLKSRDAGAEVLLLGMLIPPNYGPEYVSQFREIYPRIAKAMNVPLVPFVLEGVGGEAKLNQPDGIHPTAEGHRLMANNVLPHLRPLVERRVTGAAGSRGP
jgi:acyl-CoA thioesterase-1